MQLRSVVALLALCATSSLALAWGAHGHRLVTHLALDGLPENAPAWLTDQSTRNRIAYQSNECDRWRGVRIDALEHENSPDHYIDLELLPQFGLTLETVPPLRRNYLRQMIIAKHEHPERIDDYDPEEDATGKYEWPGFLPHAIAEHYAKLISSMRTARILESLDDPNRADQLEMARANVIYHMGLLSHWVGDAAQPLHTTKHHHGWVGDNPNDYTTNYQFHSYIDSRILDIHALDYESLAPRMRFDRTVNAKDPWNDACVHIRRSFAGVEPLYKLEKSGDLEKEPGREFLSERLCDAAETLAAMYTAAWEQSEPGPRDIERFVNYNDFRPAEKTRAAETP